MSNPGVAGTPSSRTGRWVLHLDMDAFFASAEQLTRPTLAGRPVLVGGLGPRSVVAGASYESRVFGVRSAMPMGQAKRRCPHAVVVPPRFSLYQALSERVMAVLAEAAPVLEPVSIDEAFLEPPSLAGATAAEVERFGTELRAAVREASGLPASVGAGSGKQLAKIASELAKPDGLRVIAPDVEQEVLAPLPVRSLSGIGPVAEAALHKVGVRTIGQLAVMDLREITGLLGSAIGADLHRLARGIDDRPVAPRAAAKQVSAETTFDADLTAMAAVHHEIARITVSAHRRLVAAGRAARTVTVKMRGADFATTTRSETSAVASADLGALTAVAQRLALAAVPAGGVRLIGVSLAGLGDDPPPALFAPPGADAVFTTAAPLPAVLVADDAPSPDSGRTDEAASTRMTDAPLPAGPRELTPLHTGSPGTARERSTSPAPRTGGTGPSGDGSPTDRIAEATSEGDTSAGPGAGPPAHHWRPGDDVHHHGHGHGWVQGAGHGRVTVRFETRTTGPGRARTFRDTDPDLAPADALASLGAP